MSASIALDNSILPNGADVTKSEQFYVGTIALSGNYPTGGDTLSFSVPGIQSNSVPIRVEVYEQPTTSQTATGYTFVYALGSSSANGALQILSAEGTQFPAGAYGSAFSNTTIKVRAWFPLGR